jgi:dTDP-4-dehydrorhamnose 3,5-epimerase
MEFIETPLDGLWKIKLTAREDDRGYFKRTYDEEVFAKRGLQTQWVQENQSLSVQEGTVRGLHFQRPPHCETKLVRALSGSLLDVVVDLRAGSKTYGMHYSAELSATNRLCLYIPKGFAHGFCTLQPDSILAYKVDHAYTPQAEGGLLWCDPLLQIDWPLSGDPTCISSKDQLWPTLDAVMPLNLAGNLRRAA